MTDLANDIEYLAYKELVLKAVRELKGKCRHCNKKTDPAYIDIAKYLNDPDAVEDHLPFDELCELVCKVLYRLESEGLIKVTQPGYYIRGTHGGAGAKKWGVVE